MVFSTTDSQPWVKDLVDRPISESRRHKKPHTAAEARQGVQIDLVIH
jgi:hypothetical protein